MVNIRGLKERRGFDKRVDKGGRLHTPMAMVSMPILEHIELSLATAPLLPAGVECWKRRVCCSVVVGKAKAGPMDDSQHGRHTDRARVPMSPSAPVLLRACALTCNTPAKLTHGVGIRDFESLLWAMSL